jgi:hypothetical protein
MIAPKLKILSLILTIFTFQVRGRTKFSIFLFGLHIAGISYQTMFYKKYLAMSM